MKKILDRVNFPADIKKLSDDELEVLASEVRDLIIETVSNTGGHLAPSLGSVDLTIALHVALNCPKDKIVWDVGHQCYAHKILTGRKDHFQTLRQHEGLSGFPKKDESSYDCFDSGHASNSISVALGLAKGRDILGTNETIVSVIGDGALTGGMAFEGLNQAGHQKTKLIVILNDNEMSIAKNVGAMSNYLSRIRLDPKYNWLKEEVEDWLKKVPGGETVLNFGGYMRESVKHLFVPGLIFEELGFRYTGPIDGHNIKEITENIELAKKANKPVLLHVYTTKGKGYSPAIENADTFHGTSPFVIKTGKPKKKSVRTYTSVFSDTLVKIGVNEPRLVAVTAAMSDGTGLRRFAGEFPERFFDVGIAEQHAVTFAAGLAIKGLIPVVAIYSTFMQRAFDQLMQDVALQKLHMIVAIDRAGLVGEDGPTHHGMFDLSFLRTIPNAVVMAPKDENELQHMIYSATKYKTLVAVRYPRGQAMGVKLDSDFSELPLGKAEVIKDGKDVIIWAVGSMVAKAEQVSQVLNDNGIDCGVVNARFIKPIDKKLLSKTSENTVIVTMEENTVVGGFGSSVLEALESLKMERRVVTIGLPDKFISHGNNEYLFSDEGLNVEKITKKITDFLGVPDKNTVVNLLSLNKSDRKTKT